MYTNKILQRINLWIIQHRNFKKNDNQINTMDTKDINKSQIYNFINVTHNLHKLFEALATSRLTLALLAYIVRIQIWHLFVVFFQVGKEKRLAGMLSPCSGSAKLHFYLPF